MRTLVCLGQGERIMRLAKVKPIPKHFAKVLIDGTDKAVDSALWLIWRMTRDDDFCVRLVRNLDMVRAWSSLIACNLWYAHLPVLFCRSKQSSVGQQ